MIIYIHGFGGSGEGSKAKILRPLLRSQGFIAPSLPTNPALAIATLSELIETFRRIETVMLIGSSLGGFYTLHLAAKYNLKAVLINPAVRPYETLSRALGISGGENFYDNSRYEWNESHLETLKSLTPSTVNQDNILVLLQKGDEVLDYSDAANLLEGCSMIIEEGGDHSFRGIERHVGTIKQFFAGADGVLEQFLLSAEDRDIQTFLRTIDKDDLVRTFSVIDESCRERLLSNLSHRAVESLMEEVDWCGESDIETIAKALKNLRHYARKTMGENPFVYPPDTGGRRFGLSPEILSEDEIDELLEVYERVLPEKIIEAITFAAKAHGAQMTPMGFPYLHHLMSVATHTMVGTRNDGFSIEDQENAIIAAFLHDTIEDTAIEYHDVKEAFGETIADAVSALTKNKLVGDKQAQMEDSLNRIKAQPHWVWCVKLSDRITNLTGVPAHWDEAKKQKYLSEARVLWSALHEASEDLSERLLRKIERYE
ncbi:MAG: YqiA/YcfP family alpha/beta fold hydrolase [Sulfuricurvum sp.]|jgi:hypothetical protein